MWSKILSAKIETLPGVPAGPVLGELAEELLGPFLGFEPVVYEGPALTVDSGVAPLVEHLVTRPSFSSVGKSNFEALFGWSNYHKPQSPVSTGSVSVFVDIAAVDVDVVLNALVGAAQILQAPFSFLDVGRDRFRVRENTHRDLYQEGKTGVDRRAGLCRGLSGVPWRTVLGPVLVDYFGIDALRSLSGELASEIADGFWLLTPCEQYEEWDPNLWSAGEEQIIEALGRDRFFDPVTSALPTVHPPLPPLAAIPVKTQQSFDGDAWDFWNGYPE